MGRAKQVLTHWLEGFRSKNIQYTIALAFTGITLVAMMLVGVVLYTGFFSSAESRPAAAGVPLPLQIFPPTPPRRF